MAGLPWFLSGGHEILAPLVLLTSKWKVISMVSYVLYPVYYFNNYFACHFELIKGTFCGVNSVSFFCPLAPPIELFTSLKISQCVGSSYMELNSEYSSSQLCTHSRDYKQYCFPKTLTLFFPQDGWLLPGIEQKVLAWMNVYWDMIRSPTPP